MLSAVHIEWVPHDKKRQSTDCELPSPIANKEMQEYPLYHSMFNSRSPTGYPLLRRPSGGRHPASDRSLFVLRPLEERTIRAP